MSRTRGVVLPRGGVDDARNAAVRCEELGYAACWTGELWRRDALVALTAVAEAWAGGDRDAVTAEMVDALGVAGTPEDARERFESVASLSVVDHPIVVVPEGVDAATRERALAR